MTAPAFHNPLYRDLTRPSELPSVDKKTKTGCRPNTEVPFPFSIGLTCRMVVKRKAGLTDKTAVLAAMKACRKAIAAVQMAYPSNTATYRQATHLNAELDDLALLLTGDAEALWDHPRGAAVGRSLGRHGLLNSEKAAYVFRFHGGMA